MKVVQYDTLPGNENPPTDPYATGALGIVVSGKTAYVRDHLGINFVDISNPANPRVTDKIYLGGNITAGMSLDIAVNGNYLYIDNWNWFMAVSLISKKIDFENYQSNTHAIITHNGVIYSISKEAGAPRANIYGMINPSQGTRKDLVIIKKGPSANSRWSGLGNLATYNNYLIAPDGFIIMNTRGSSSQLETVYSNNNLGGSLVSIFGNKAYVVSSTGGTLRVIDITSPEKPLFSDPITLSGVVTSLSSTGDYVYAIIGNNLKVLNVSSCEIKNFPTLPQNTPSSSSSSSSSASMRNQRYQQYRLNWQRWGYR